MNSRKYTATSVEAESGTTLLPLMPHEDVSQHALSSIRRIHHKAAHALARGDTSSEEARKGDDTPSLHTRPHSSHQQNDVDRVHATTLSRAVSLAGSGSRSRVLCACRRRSTKVFSPHDVVDLLSSDDSSTL